MKKTLSLAAIALVAATSLTACGGDDSADEAGGSTAPTTTTSSSPTQEGTSPTQETQTSTEPAPSTTSKDTSDGQSSDYCTKLKSARGDLQGLGAAMTQKGKFNKVLGEFQQLQDAAPPQVKDDWGTLNDKFTQLKTILAKAGLSIDDLAGLSQGKVPKGVSKKDLQKVGKELQSFSQDKSAAKAGDAIAAHGKKACNIDLNSGG
ncbi:MAG: hypothetical protein ACRDQA_04720 [Nocardioidaceae bacterium]